MIRPTIEKDFEPQPCCICGRPLLSPVKMHTEKASNEKGWQESADVLDLWGLGRIREPAEFTVSGIMP